ncbi:hypothetical protein [Pseudomonas gingeri]|uniref:Uncharacterized protein n=1 Tax=Pseudomonas gingeri TaxID=117681 RepID=A0A7Y7YAB9_9PSED|nr:hypothetical protein [Pseudomonas gingeri]NWA04201.1 hypothetical protein [Pseudomonas gingeri]NWA17547.1 hypothetical protein [Pseudomonas gingeri]NWA56508.1 hypothetical protein [Pseudomonas gingeri]NWA97818.1 hypothetical protein [Pseudomonas gingeri]NWB05341.1 hypothetical protein [Pseudomonas gingeri]
MSSIHEQAMNYVYQQVLQRLMSYFSRAERIALQLLIQRLIVAAGGIERIGEFKVMVPHGGGKDSSYTLAFLRAAQLSIAGRSPATFNLRIATLRHAGVTTTVMHNIHRGYCALFVYDDPRVELLMVDNKHVRPFHHRTPMSDLNRDLNRRNLLMNGHLTAGDGRATFCNSCYLSMADFHERASAWDKGISALVIGDPPREQKQYLTWLLRSTERPDRNRQGGRPLEFDEAVRTCNELSLEYYRELYGDTPAQPQGPAIGHASTPMLVSVYDLVGSSIEQRWPLLTEFLGFRFDDLAFHFSESDCANPLLMAHMRGLQAQYVRGLSYQTGITEYLQLAAVMMRKKLMSARLIEQALAAYDTPEKLLERRSLAGVYAQEAYGLREEQLICLLFAPFVNQGRGLELFLRHCHPGMLVALPELHRALSAQPSSEQVEQWLKDVSGLTLELLQDLYQKTRVDFSTAGSLIARVRAGDPDKHRIDIINPDNGEVCKEVLSGR